MDEINNQVPDHSETAQTLDYASPSTNSRLLFPRKRIFEWTIALGLIFSVAAVMLQAVGRSGPGAPRTQCGANLHAIVTALVMYANNHSGRFPDSLESAVTDPSSLMSPQEWAKVLVCPGTDGTPASGTTAQEVATNLTSRGVLGQLLSSTNHPFPHLSYIYAGKGITTKSAADTVVLYEPPDHHMVGKVASMNVAYQDGSVRTYSGDAAKKLFAELQSGHNPPRPEMLK